MSRLNFEDELNGPQLRAVTSLEGPVMIIAGAGSGKTRVITYRIARMLEKGIPQSAILALTFTNKAAREMEDRVKELTGKKLQNLTVSTFHAFGVKILREEIEVLGYRKNFSIYDEADRIQLIKDCLRECRLAPDGVDLAGLGRLFSDIKTGRAFWRHEGGRADDSFERVYREYQSSLKVFNALDFDGLLTVPLEIFETNPGILEKHRKRYRYIMVDEFQDTSHTQYRLMKMLASPNEDGKCNVCVVGDDDQSIYSWRGADYRNLLAFEEDFPGAEEIKLEQNYRSTTTILEAANGVIAHNTMRREKKLWSGGGGGKPIILCQLQDEGEEAAFIAARIRALRVEDRLNYSDFGVLLRTNSMTRSIEEAFLAENIPYRVSGGKSFFQRKEIKDIISYLRVVANNNDDINLLRIINTPRRGIGKTTIASLAELAKKNHSSLWEALCRVHVARHNKDIDEFMNLMDFFKSQFLTGKEPRDRALSRKVRGLVDRIDYWSYLVSEYSKNEKAARWRFTNIEYLIQSIENWEQDPDNLDPTLYPYLNRISLITSDDRRDEAGDETGKVNLMTIHAAKGLEFPVVFIAGAEDGIMPHTRSIEDGEDTAGSLEEERRLFYVAITRARNKLFISGCLRRRRLQNTIDCAPSPFLTEIPPHLIEHYQEKTPADQEKEAEYYFSLIRNRLKKNREP